MWSKLARASFWVIGAIVLLGAICNHKPAPAVLIYGITPAEAKSGEAISIRGRLLDQAGLRVRLCNGQCYDAAIIEQAPHFATVVVPSTIPYERAQYWVYAGTGGQLGVETVADKSRYVYLRGGGAPPTSQQLRIFVGSATWKFLCDADGKHCNEIPYAPYDYWYGCHYPWPSARSHASWTTHPWSRYRLLIDQAVRDWSTMCSRAWADPDHSKQLASNWIEAATREEWEHNWWFWLETARDMPIETCPNDGADWHWSLCDVFLCDWRRAGCTGSGPLYQIASGKTYFCDEYGTRLNICGMGSDDCAYHGTPLEAVAIWFVGAFFYYGEEVDPTDPYEGVRGFAGTSSPALVDTYAIGEASGLDSHGLIFLSQSPYKGYFPHPATKGNNVNPLRKAEQNCTAESCWPGPGYSDDATPNVLAHELMHVLTNRRDPSQTASLEDTIWIQSDRDDGGIYRRGFSLRASALKATAQTECAEARAGDDKDFTE
jgi:hypothetical protein